MIELIVAGLGTGRTSADKRGPVLHEPDDFGALYLAFDPALLGGDGNGHAAVENLLADITGLGGRLPGESSREQRDARLASGSVTLDADALTVLGLAAD